MLDKEDENEISGLNLRNASGTGRHGNDRSSIENKTAEDVLRFSKTL